jgi:hypothetical protein
MANDVQWQQKTWDAINQAIRDEDGQLNIGKNILPYFQVDSEVPYVPAERIDPETLTISETDKTSIIEIAVNFALTKAQYKKEDEIPNPGTLAIYAQKDLTTARDVLLFQGHKGFETDKLFTSNKVIITNGPSNSSRNGFFRSSHNNSLEDFFGPGILGAAELTRQIVQVEPVEPDPKNPAQNSYGENTFGKVAVAISILRDAGHIGPFSLVFNIAQFADSLRALRNTLVTPADRIKELIADHNSLPGATGPDSKPVRFYGTSAVPPFKGALISFGGKSVELVLGMDPTVMLLSETLDGLIHLSVNDRFALIIRDFTAIVEFDFLHSDHHEAGKR